MLVVAIVLYAAIEATAIAIYVYVWRLNATKLAGFSINSVSHSLDVLVYDRNLFIVAVSMFTGAIFLATKY